MRWDWLSSLRNRRFTRNHNTVRRRGIDARRRISQFEMLEQRTLLTLLRTWDVTLDPDGDHGWDQDGNEFHILTSLPDPNLPVVNDVSDFDPQPLTLEETFQLHSRPSAAHTVYLDFDGHVTSGTGWQGGGTFTTPEFDRDGDTSSFSQAELDEIFDIWERVVEDFAPFDVDVTTEEPPLADLQRTGAGDDAWGIRVAIGGHFNDWLGSSAGGIAFIGSFNSGIDTPTYVFSEVLGSAKSVAEATSHEVGHTLGLGHDGDSANPYYGGHGTGPTGWAPIMGVGYSRALVTWSRGEYTDANNQQDDLQIITSQNGFDYRIDLAGDTNANAAPLTLNGVMVEEAGVVETSADVDVYRFVTGDGPVSFDIQPWHRSPNLDILAELRAEDGTLIASSNPIGMLDAQISETLQDGVYYLHISGVGEGDPKLTGYTDYASIGQFTITGSITEPSHIDVEVVGGNLVLTDTYDKNSGLTVRIESGTVVIESQVFQLEALTGVTQVAPMQVTVPLVDVTGSVIFDLAGGDDNVDLQLPDGFLDLPFDFQGGSGTDSFMISGAGLTPVSTATYTRSGLNDGDVQYAAAVPTPVVTYSGLESFVDQTTAAVRDVQVTGSVATLQVDGGASLIDGQISVASTGGTTLDIGGPATSLQIDTSLSATGNVVTIGSLVGELSAALNVTGSVNDSVILASSYDPGANPVNLVAGSVQLDAALGSATSSGDLHLAATNLGVNAPVESNGSLRIQPFDPVTSIGLGDTSTGIMQLDDFEMSQLGSRFQRIEIGDPVAAAGPVDITSGSFRTTSLISGSTIAVTGLDVGRSSVELSALTGAIASLADTMDPGFMFDVSGASVTLSTSDTVSGEIGSAMAPIYVSTAGLITDSTASGADQFLATLDSSAAVSSIAGGVFNIEEGTFDAGNSTALLNAAGLHIGDSGTGRFDLAGNSVTVASVSGATNGGTIQLGAETLTVDGSQTSTFEGEIVGTGGLVKAGSGTQTLAGVNSYSGDTDVTDGVLLIDGSIAGNVTIAGGVLGGSGAIAGNVEDSTSGGGIAPGNSPGQLTVSGDVTLDGSQTFSVEIEGLTPGTEHDQLVLDGSPAVLTLNDAVLNASISGYVPTTSDEITIVDLVDPTSSVVGHFADLPEGTSVEIDGFAFTISYAGGTDGNDVVLTAVPVGVRVVALQSSVAEDSGSALTFQFQRFGQTAPAVTVNFSVAGLADATDFNLTGPAGTSYDSGTMTGSVDFLSGETSFDIQITPIADGEYELDEDVVVTVEPGAGYEPGATVSDSAVIENDDTGIALSINQASVPEQGPGTLVYTFTRLESTVGTLSVNFGISGASTATLGTDYLLTGATTLAGSTGTIVFADGQETFDVVVVPVNDDLFELPETVIVDVLAGTGYDAGEPLEESSQTGTIVNEDNASPTLNPIAPITVTEDDPMQTIGLGGITAGFSDQQNLRVTAVSSRPDIIPDPTVIYTSPLTTGQLQFTPVVDAWGPLTFTVTVEDGGLDDDLSTTGDNLTFSRVVDVLVRPVNDDPTLSPIANENVDEDSGEHSVPLAGMSPGPKEFEPFHITAVSSDPALIPFIAIDHDPQAPMGVLRYRTGENLSGLATITVTVTDAGADGTLTTPGDNLIAVQTFDVMVDPVNDPPSLDSLPAVVVDEDSGVFEIDLTGITGGPGESERVDLGVRTLDTGGSFDDSVIESATILSYTPGDTSAILRLTPRADAFGDAIIELTLTDYGFDDNFGTMGDNAVSVVTFSVAVRPINDPPVAMNQNFTVPEASPAGTLVGAVAATDVDMDRLRFEIKSGNESGAFTLDTNSGELLVNDQGAIDYETLYDAGTMQATIDLVVEVTDLGNPPETVEIDVTVNVTDASPERELTVEATDWLSDAIIVRRAGAMLEFVEIVDVSGAPLLDAMSNPIIAPVNEIDQIVIHGNDDLAENVLVDFMVGNAFGNGDPVPPRGLIFNGGSGAVQDSVDIRAGLSDVFSDVTHELTGPDSLHIRANDNVILANGVEHLTDTLRASQRLIQGTGGDDDLTLLAGVSAGDFLAELQSTGTTPSVTFGTPVVSIAVELGGGADSFTVDSFELGLRGRLSINGQDGDDAFFIDGLNGDPVTLEGGSGIDSVFEVQGAGIRIGNELIEDTTVAGLPQTLVSISGVDFVEATGTSGSDVLDATDFAGNVRLVGLEGDDLLIGGPGDDVLDGGDDRDHLIGGPGNDLLLGGLHADTLTGHEGADEIDGQGGADRLLETASGSMTLAGRELDTNGERDVLRGIVSAFLFGEGGNDVIDASAFSGWVRLTGGEGDDTLTGSRFSDILDGQGGDDVLLGLTGSDYLFGGGGLDTIDGAAGDDEIRGGRDADSIDAGDGDDFIVGEHGHDVIVGGAGRDRIIGGGGRDTLTGNSGADVLIGNGGIDVVSESFAGAVEVTRVGLNGASTGADSFGAVERVVLTGSDGADYVNATGFLGSLSVFAGAGDDVVIGGQGNDVLHGAAGRDRLEGLAGDDILAGQDGDDLLLGGAGDDFLVGGAGNDILDGGAGDDRLRGNGGEDALRGGAGNDLLEGNSQNDLLLGGSGDDTLKGGKGNDTLLGEAGSDNLDGERNNDTGTGGGNGSGASAMDVLSSVEVINDAFSVDFDALIAAF